MYSRRELKCHKVRFSVYLVSFGGKYAGSRRTCLFAVSDRREIQSQTNPCQCTPSRSLRALRAARSTARPARITAACVRQPHAHARMRLRLRVITTHTSTRLREHTTHRPIGHLRLSAVAPVHTYMTGGSLSTLIDEGGKTCRPTQHTYPVHLYVHWPFTLSGGLGT